MLDLPTIKTDFLFENSQDFNQTTHARPQHSIVFIDIISLYFNCISSVKYLSNGHVTVMSCLFLQYDPSTNPKNRVRLLQKAGKVLTHSYGMQFSFCSFQFSKWRLVVGMTEISKDQIRKYFTCYIILQLF